MTTSLTTYLVTSLVTSLTTYLIIFLRLWGIYLRSYKPVAICTPSNKLKSLHTSDMS